MPSRRRTPAADPDGPGLPPRTVLPRPQVTERCSEPGYGERDAGAIAEMAGLATPRVPDGWIYIQVRSSAIPGRWFCSAPCAAVGIALAQVRLAAAPPKR